MSRRHQLIGLAAAAGLVVWLLGAGNGGLALAGVSLALLICPLVMGAVMWLLMRQPPSPPRRHEGEPHDDQTQATVDGRFHR